MKVDTNDRHRPRPGKNSYRWDEIGGYVVSTIRFPPLVAEANGANFETIVYSMTAGEWDYDRSGVHSNTEAEADAAHQAVCDQIRGKIQ